MRPKLALSTSPSYPPQNDADRIPLLETCRWRILADPSSHMHKNPPITSVPGFSNLVDNESRFKFYDVINTDESSVLSVFPLPLLGI